MKVLIKIHHVQITIPIGAEDSAREFYCEMLGMKEILKPKNLSGRDGFWLSLGNQQIHIGTEPNFNRMKTKAHIAYQVNDLEFWREKLLLNNVECKNDIQIKGMQRFTFRDPFGNRVEFLQLD